MNSVLERRVDDFGAKCLRRIMRYRWNDFVLNQRLCDETESRPVSSLIRTGAAPSVSCARAPQPQDWAAASPEHAQPSSPTPHAQPLPKAPTPREDTHSEDEEPRPSKAARREASEEEETATVLSPAATPADEAKLSSMETLVRLFPGRKVQVLEAVLLRCSRDAAGYPDAAVRPPPPHCPSCHRSPHHIPHHREQQQHHRASSSGTPSTTTTPSSTTPQPRPSPPRSPEPRHHDLF
ncbi:putative uncharacterized protein DDB_G0290521 [Eriocheir sinensis]|uniref:putative uncharacterized protein DDB_G0290521 n=1 Tax=Eriocheir sinensis TaxID=95602 RepID=UPI0021C7355C|nr:putative uncharacterized protein DDB_G0290521 [Eriocheir sinensis]